MNQFPNHVAILVPSVKKASIYLGQFGFQVGEEEQFDGEGTREIYIESSLGNSLLLMEPLDHGLIDEQWKNVDQVFIILLSTSWI